jgi:hypothetical protein
MHADGASWRALTSVSFTPSEVNEAISGRLATAEKKLNDARLGTPFSCRVEIQPMGRAPRS